MSGVARALNVANHRTRAGRSWTIASVRRFLLREGMGIALPSAYRDGAVTSGFVSVMRRRRLFKGTCLSAYSAVTPSIIGWYQTNLSLPEIARKLNAGGKVTRFGKAWTRQDVRRLLSREGVF
jgi:hypothetical protein